MTMIGERTTEQLQGQLAYLRQALRDGHPALYGDKERKLLLAIHAELCRRRLAVIQDVLGKTKG